MNRWIEALDPSERPRPPGPPGTPAPSSSWPSLRDPPAGSLELAPESEGGSSSSWSEWAEAQALPRVIGAREVVAPNGPGGGGGGGGGGGEGARVGGGGAGRRRRKRAYVNNHEDAGPGLGLPPPPLAPGPEALGRRLLETRAGPGRPIEAGATASNLRVTFAPAPELEAPCGESQCNRSTRAC